MYEYLLSPIGEKFSLPFLIESFPIVVLFFIVGFVVFLVYALNVILKHNFIFKRKIWLKIINDFENLENKKNLNRSQFWGEYSKILREFLSEFNNPKAKSAILKDLKMILGDKLVDNVENSYFLGYSEGVLDTYEFRTDTLNKTIKYIKSKIVLW